MLRSNQKAICFFSKGTLTTKFCTVVYITIYHILYYTFPDLLCIFFIYGVHWISPFYSTHTGRMSSNERTVMNEVTAHLSVKIKLILRRKTNIKFKKVF